jgi:hypothetical protein
MQEGDSLREQIRHRFGGTHMASEYVAVVCASAVDAVAVAVHPGGADANERSPRCSGSARTPLPALAPCMASALRHSRGALHVGTSPHSHDPVRST